MKIDPEEVQDDMQFGDLVHFIAYTNTLENSIDYDWRYLIKGYAQNKATQYIKDYIRQYCIHDVSFIIKNNRKVIRIEV